jgi:hypothetical protein
MFYVVVDFHNEGVLFEQKFDTFEELGLYLERVPANQGFLKNKTITIHIQMVPKERSTGAQEDHQVCRS